MVFPNLIEISFNNPRVSFRHVKFGGAQRETNVSSIGQNRYPEYYGVPTEDPQMQCAVKDSVQGFHSPCDSYILLDPESLPRYISFLRQIFQKD
jgi:hypothetical protein